VTAGYSGGKPTGPKTQHLLVILPLTLIIYEVKISLKNLRNSLFIALATFFIAILVTFASQTRVQFVSMPVAILILLIIIITGIISDMIGVAATVARPEPFNAKASKKISGAKYGLYLVKHGDKVASLMCDIVGDICGTVSGAIGAVIVIRIINYWNISSVIISLIVIGITSAITVGGKAFFKSYGIKKADEIIFFVGRIIASLNIFLNYFRKS